MTRASSPRSRATATSTPVEALHRIGRGGSGRAERPRPEWQRKGATLSDKTARKEFGLTQVVAAIRTGQLHYREASMHGCPWLRLLRWEVEALVTTTHGESRLKGQQAKTELASINRELKGLKAQVAALEERRAKVIGEGGK